MAGGGRMGTAVRQSRRIVSGQISIHTLLSFGFGLAMIAALLVLAIAVPNPEPAQLKIFMVVLALAAGGIGAVLPGFIEVQHKGLLRAGGAIGLSVLVLFFQPVVEKNAVNYKVPSMDPLPVAQEFMSLNDEQRIDTAWSVMDPAVRELSFLDLARYKQIARTFRAPLGAAKSREFVGGSSAISPTGLPVGLYRFLIWRSRFAADQGCRYEWVVLRASQQSEWKVASYQIEARPQPCDRPLDLTPPTSL
jgi:hypothetical protein